MSRVQLAVISRYTCDECGDVEVVGTTVRDWCPEHRGQK